MHEGRPTAYIFIRPPCLRVRARGARSPARRRPSREEENDDEEGEEEREGTEDRPTGQRETERFRKAATGIRKSEDRRPKTHRESVVVAPTDGRTNGRVNRGSHLLFTTWHCCLRCRNRHRAHFRGSPASSPGIGRVISNERTRVIANVSSYLVLWLLYKLILNSDPF